MKWKFLNIPLGASAPYGNSRKCVGEDAIVGLGTSVLSGLFGMMNTDNTNAANRAMAHETNQYNYSINMANRELQREMFQRQLAEARLQREEDRRWYLQDLADERAYNDPSSVAARLRAAGINPVLAMQSMGLGHSGGSGVMSNPGTSVPSFQAPQTIPMQMGPAQIPYDLSEFDRFGQMMFDMAFRRTALDQEWVKILKDAPLDPETKDFILKKKVFADDNSQNISKNMLNEQYMALVNDNALKQMNLNIASEENDAKRSEWKRLADKHPYELKLLINSVNRWLYEKQILEDEHLLNEDKHSFNDKGLEVLQKEVDRIGRQNALWSGDFSMRAVFELLMSIFNGSNIIGLISALK